MFSFAAISIENAQLKKIKIYYDHLVLLTYFYSQASPPQKINKTIEIRKSNISDVQMEAQLKNVANSICFAVFMNIELGKIRSVTCLVFLRCFVQFSFSFIASSCISLHGNDDIRMTIIVINIW